MKKFLIPLFTLFLSAAVFAQGSTNVVFQVNMGALKFQGVFNPGSDSLTVRGDFQAVAGDPGGDWQGYFFKMSPSAGDTIYSVTATIPNSNSGTTYHFKFVQNDGGWESIADNRQFTLDTSSATQTLPVVYFNNDTNFTAPIPKYKNTVKFTADLATILGSGVGFFDPSVDSIQVMGLDWDGLGVLESGNRTMTQDPFQSNLFSAVLTFRGTGLADSTKWKFKAFPDSSFTNTGWETGQDRWYHYSSDTVNTIVLPTVVPTIFPVQEALTTPVDVTFYVDMNGAKDVRTDQVISNLKFVGLRGGASFLGDWSSGSWNPTDTIGLANMKVLYDDGTHGDLTASDNIWSLKITVPTGTAGGNYEYKYGAWFTGADSVNAGSSPMDNEMPFAVNHSFILRNGPAIVLNNKFGVQSPVTGVERLNNTIPDTYSLSQNYPNPFNPSTIINYSIPSPGVVTLKVFDMLGREVSTLVNTQQAAGTYKVSFDASQLASGVYFYRISTNKFVSTKKMLLLK